MIRDLYDVDTSRRLLAQVTMLFSIAPAVAPLIGGRLFVWFGWRSIFAFMALTGAGILATSLRYLPESLPPDRRQSFELRSLSNSYVTVGTQPRFLWLSFAVGLNFTGFFVYVASAPAYVTQVLQLGATEFAWLFLPGVGGIMFGAFLATQVAGRMNVRRSVALGYGAMGTSMLVNLLYTQTSPTVALPWAVLPLFGYTTGMAFNMPAISLLVLDAFPRARGTAASLQGFVSVFLNGLVSALLVPSLPISAAALALAMAVLWSGACLCWLGYLDLSAEPARRLGSSEQ